MANKTEIQLFENRQVRTAWNNKQEQWYFSIVDVRGILTNSAFNYGEFAIIKSQSGLNGFNGTMKKSNGNFKTPNMDNF